MLKRVRYWVIVYVPPLSHSLSPSHMRNFFSLHIHIQTYNHQVTWGVCPTVHWVAFVNVLSYVHTHIHMFPCVNVCGPLEASLKATKCACNSSSNDVGSEGNDAVTNTNTHAISLNIFVCVRVWECKGQLNSDCVPVGGAEAKEERGMGKARK